MKVELPDGRDLVAARVKETRGNRGELSWEHDQIRLSWQDNSSDENGFTVQRAVNGGSYSDRAAARRPGACRPGAAGQHRSRQLEGREQRVGLRGPA